MKYLEVKGHMSAVFLSSIFIFSTHINKASVVTC